MFLGDDHPDTISVKHALDLVADAMPDIKQNLFKPICSVVESTKIVPKVKINT
jgi:hypothetical protein